MSSNRVPLKTRRVGGAMHVKSVSRLKRPPVDVVWKGGTLGVCTLTADTLGSVLVVAGDELRVCILCGAIPESPCRGLMHIKSVGPQSPQVGVLW
ncbi:hypothetical protein TNCV_3069111 [Trichonephila clavipes]|nr:hypothetical protein TNCV_3069111 [Trichonephila clavipes]